MQQPWLIIVEQPLECAPRDGIAIVAVCRYVEQQDIDTGIGELPGDPEAHGSGPDYGRGFDLVHGLALPGGVVFENEVPE